MSNTYESVSCQQLAEICRQDGNVDLIDVRTPLEFREVHSQYARNVPLDALDPQAVFASRDDSAQKPLYVICQSGNRSRKACEAFVKAGYTNIVNVDGGTTAWNAAGLPCVRGKKAVSLERQVRIAAGFLVFLGATLGFFVHPYFIGLSAFVGAGLMFAGITDTCAMGMLIAKMPWNQVGASCETKPTTTTKTPSDAACSA